MSSSLDLDAARLFKAAVSLDPSDRAAFLASECRDDPALIARVERLLRLDSDTSGFLESPVRRDERAAGSQADSTAPDPLIGQAIGRYRIVRAVGRGGMGVVYEALQEHPARTVALKVMRPGIASDSALRRFQHEADVLGQLQHPGIAQIFEAGTEQVNGATVPYFAMELILGVSLSAYATQQELSLRESLELMAGVCDAVQHAHQKGVIHRDLKPANILIADSLPTSDFRFPMGAGAQSEIGNRKPLTSRTRSPVPDVKGRSAIPKVVDFGVARVMGADVNAATLSVEVGQIIGTLAYMSPEQISGDARSVDTRCDVYALGAILYELLSGRLPHEVRSVAIPEALRRIREDTPPPPRLLRRNIDEDVQTIVLKCLAKERERRYQSAGELGRDLRRYLAGEPIEARRDSALYVLGKTLRRYRWPAAAAAAFVVVLAVSSVWLWVLYQARGRAFDRAERARAAEAAQRDKAERVAAFTEDVMAGASPFVSIGRDTRLLEDMLDAAADRIGRGELAEAPEAELRLRMTIGNTLRGVSAYDAAGEMLAPAVELARRLHASDHPDTARALSYLGWLQHDTGDSSTALETWEEALAMRRRLFPGDHDDVAMGLNHAATALEALGRFPEALSTYQEALAMAERLHPGDHYSVADLTTNVANCLLSLGRINEALPQNEAALAMYQRLHSGDHPRIAAAMNNVAGCLKALGRLTDALPVFEESLAMRQRLRAADDPNAANTLSNLAACLRDLGREPEALPRHEEALAMYQRLYPGDHPAVARSLNGLGLCYYRMGQGERALEYYQQALDMRRRLLEGDHPDLAISIGNVGSALAALGRFDQAIPMHEETAAMMRRLYAGDHLSVAISLHNLADTCDNAGRPGEALAPFEESVAMRQRILPADHTEVIIGMVRLGAVLGKLGRFDEAEPMLLDAADRLIKRSHATPKLKRMAFESLAKLYEARDAIEPDTGYAAKAAEWRARLGESN